MQLMENALAAKGKSLRSFDMCATDGATYILAMYLLICFYNKTNTKSIKGWDLSESILDHVQPC